MNIRQLNETIKKALGESVENVQINSLDDLENYIRKNKSFPDDFDYNGAKYTMHEYDMEGKTITYVSCDNEQGISVETPEGRYTKGIDYNEMEIDIEEYEPFSVRNDITYYSIDGDTYSVMDSDKDGIVWSKSSDSFSIDVWNKTDRYENRGAMVYLGKHKKDSNYTIYITSRGLQETIDNKVKSKEEAIEVVKEWLAKKLNLTVDKVDYEIKTFGKSSTKNESVSIKEDKETMTIQKALKEIEEYYSDDELAEMDEDELRERLGETIERVLIYNEDVIDLWKAMWMESSASSSVMDEITSDVRSYLENEVMEILKPKTKAE